MSAAAGETFSLEAAVGGVRGVVESLLPSLLFLVIFLTTHQVRTAIIVSLGAAAVLTVARLAVRSSPTQTLAGLVGVAICAWNANRTGDAKDYYVPGFWINLAYGLVFLISLIPLPALTIGGRLRSKGSYPVLGLVVGPLLNEGLGWRDHPARRRAYTLATLSFVALYFGRLAVQLPLYLSDNLTGLGIARLIMGVPLMALCVWLSWLLIRRPHDA